MAYGKKYTFTFADDNATSWTCDIYKDGFVGSVTDVVTEGRPILLKWGSSSNLFDPIKGSEAVVSLMSQTDKYYSEFYTAKMDDYYLEVKKGGTTIWTGLYIADSFGEPYVAPPYPTTLRFSCGLGDLKYRRYENSGALYSGEDSLLNIILNCLNQLPTEVQKSIYEQINIFETNQNKTDSDGMLTQTKVNQALFIEQNENGDDQGMPCSKVLQWIMVALGCRIYQADNKWWVTRVEELKTNSIHSVLYDSAGAYVSDTTVAPRETIDNDKDSGITWIEPPHDLSIGEIFNQINYRYQHTLSRELGGVVNGPSQIVRNSYFGRGWLTLDGPHYEGWEDKNTPYWYELGSGIGATELEVRANPNTNTSLTLGEMQGCYFTASLFGDTQTGIPSTHWIKPIWADGETVTQASMPQKTTDKFRFNWAGYFDKYCILPNASPVANQSYIDDDINQCINYWVMFQFEILVEDDAAGNPDKYYVGVEGDGPLDVADSGAWQSSQGYYKVWKKLTTPPAGPASTVKDWIDLSFDTAVFPYSQTGDVSIKFFVPYGAVATRPDLSPVASAADNCYPTGFWLEQWAINYLDSGDLVDEVSSSVSTIADDSLRIKHYDINTFIGDGPSNISLGAMRYGSAPTTLTSDWDYRGGASSYTAREIFNLIPVQDLMSDYRRRISGQLYEKTSTIAFSDTIYSTDSKTYAFNKFAWDAIRCTYTVEMEEVNSFGTSWATKDFDDVKDVFDIEPPIDPSLDGDTRVRIGSKGLDSLNSKVINPNLDDTVSDLTDADHTAFPDSGPSVVRGLYTFNEDDTSNVRDYSQNGNDSTSTNSLTIVSGDVGEAGRFDGSASRAVLPLNTDLDGATDVTVMAKVNKDTDKDQVVYQNNENVELGFDSSGYVQFRVHTGSAWVSQTSTSTVTSSAWHTIAGVYNGTDMRIYIDGTLDDTQAQTGALDTSANEAAIGRGYSFPSGTEYFDGDIEAVMISDSEYSATDISDLDDMDIIGPSITLQGTHNLDVGDIVSANEESETYQIRYAVTANIDTSTVRVMPTGTRRFSVLNKLHRVGNMFDTDRQGYMKIWMNGTDPEMYVKSVTAEAELDTTPYGFYVNKAGLTTAYPPDYLKGFNMTWASTTRVLVGSADQVSACRDETDTANLKIDAGANQVLTSSSGAGGLDTGSKTNSTWYHIWVIWKADDTWAAMMSLAFTEGSITYPTDYIYARRIGTIYIDSSGNIQKFFQYTYKAEGHNTRKYHWDLELNTTRVLNAGSATSYTLVSCSIGVPATAQEAEILTLFYNNNASAATSDKYYLRPTGSTVTTPLVLGGTGSKANGGSDNHTFPVFTQSIYYKVQSTYDDLYIYITGYTEEY